MWFIASPKSSEWLKWTQIITQVRRRLPGAIVEKMLWTKNFISTPFEEQLISNIITYHSHLDYDSVMKLDVFNMIWFLQQGFMSNQLGCSSDRLSLFTTICNIQFKSNWLFLHGKIGNFFVQLFVINNNELYYGI